LDRPSKSKAIALLDALEARDYTSDICHAASHPKPLPTCWSFWERKWMW
jgi:hypothetical protein